MCLQKLNLGLKKDYKEKKRTDYLDFTYFTHFTSKQYTPIHFTPHMMKNPSTFVSRFNKNNQDELMKYLKDLDIAYTKGEPILPDNMYDEIRDLAYRKFPSNKYFDDVGAPVLTNEESTGMRTGISKKVVLPNYMGSLSKIIKDNKPISDTSSASFNLSRFLNTFSGNEFVIMDKLDGISAVIYKGNQNQNQNHNQREKEQTKMYTRGDGYVGQDISWILPHIQGVDKIDQSPPHIVRGELVVTRKEFETVKEKRANARNMVAGLINAKTPEISLLKLVRFVPYTLIDPQMKPTDQMKWCTLHGYDPVYYSVHTGSDIDVDELSRTLVERRVRSQYDIDGIVLTHNAHYAIEKGKNPKHSVAFKQLEDTADVQVERVVWDSSKNGLMKPVVHFQPTLLSGAKIQRATGINAKFIKDNKIGPGAMIRISRSGEVIPKILEVLVPADEPSLPSENYEWNKTGVDIVIQDHEMNDDVIMKNITMFFTTFKVSGLSSGNVKKLYNAGYQTVGSILDALKNSFKTVLGDKNGSNIYNAVQKLKDEPLDWVQLMYATNSFGQGFGERKLKLILDAIPDIIENNYTPTLSQLEEISSISETTGSQFLEGLVKFRTFMSNHPKLRCMGKVEEKKRGKEGEGDGRLKDMIVLFTGFRDEALVQRIKELGGDMALSLTKKVDILVCKEINEKSQKIKQAREMGNVKIMDITEFKASLE